jgi:hypothetical protein
VVPGVDVIEPRGERVGVEVAHPETQELLVERGDLVEPLDAHHDVAEAQRASAKSRDRAPRPEAVRRLFGAMEHLDARADRVGEYDQIADATFIRERTRAALDGDTRLLELGRKRVERSCIGDFPAEELDSFAAVGLDDHALPAIVHPKRSRRCASVDELEAEHAGAVRPPFVEGRRVEADVAQCLQRHVR